MRKVNIRDCNRAHHSCIVNVLLCGDVIKQAKVTSSTSHNGKIFKYQILMRSAFSHIRNSFTNSRYSVLLTFSQTLQYQVTKKSIKWFRGRNVRIADRWITAFPLRVKRSHPNYPIARVCTFDPVSATGPTPSPDISFVTSPMLQKKSLKSYTASKSILTTMQYCLRTHHCLKLCALHNKLRF